MSDVTLQTYESDSVVDLYDRLRFLVPEEEEFFRAYVPPGKRVLDIGVGAGRTTPVLSSEASRYVGVDYAENMVKRCRERFPGLEFVCLDATDMSRFATASFDVVVFSLNGLGTLPNDEARAKCIRECARVLEPGGVFLFSLHNPDYLLFRPEIADVGAFRAAWRLTYAMVQSARNVRHRLTSRAFWRGHGYVVDPNQHGSLTIYVCSPAKVEDEARNAGLRFDRGPGRAARTAQRFVTPYYYYACRKPA